VGAERHELVRATALLGRDLGNRAYLSQIRKLDFNKPGLARLGGFFSLCREAGLIFGIL
jgi:hypothetical protein